MSDHYTTVISNCKDRTFAYIDGLITNPMSNPKAITIVKAFLQDEAIKHGYTLDTNTWSTIYLTKDMER